MADRPRAYAGHDAFVFVCYAHTDRDIVYPEISRLNENGFQVWYDEGISAGSEWSAAIADAIERCDVFLYLISPESVVSEHCRRELNFALEQRCGLLAMHVVPTDVPSALKLSLSHRQAILMYDDARYAEKLEAALRQTISGDVPTASAARLLVGECTLDIDAQRLERQGESLSLDPKDLSVLLHLADEAPNVVTTESLMLRSWPGAVVGDNALQQVIARLRKAFGDSAREPAYIRTVPRRGYQLLVQPAIAEEAVEEDGRPDTTSGAASASVPGRRWAIAAAAIAVALICVVAALRYTQPGQEEPASTLDEKRIAVLDFVDLSPSAEFDWLANGISQEVRHQLGGLDDLRGPAQGAGQQPRAQRIRRRGGYRHRRKPAGERRWGGGQVRRGRSADGRGAVGDVDQGRGHRLHRHPEQGGDRAGAVVRRDPQRVAVGLGTQNPEAQDAFLKYLYHQQGARPDVTVRHLRQTLEADPGWAIGWSILGDTYLRFVPWTQDLAYVDMAREAHARATSLGRDERIALFTEAQVTGYIEGDLLRAEEMLRSYETIADGGYHFAYLMLAAGLVEEARDYYARWLKVEPYQSAWDALGVAEATLGNWQAAVDASKRCAYHAPPRSYNCHFGQFAGLPRTDLVAARRLLAEMRETLPTLSRLSSTHRLLSVMWIPWFEFRIVMAEGDLAKARQIADSFAGEEAPPFKAMMLFELGDSLASQYVDLSIARARFVRMYFPHLFSMLDPALHDHPEVVRWREGLGFTPALRLALCERAALWEPSEEYFCDPSRYR